MNNELSLKKFFLINLVLCIIIFSLLSLSVFAQEKASSTASSTEEIIIVPPLPEKTIYEMDVPELINVAEVKMIELDNLNILTSKYAQKADRCTR